MWEYWDMQKLSEVMGRYVGRVPDVTVFNLEAQGVHRAEEICHELEIRQNMTDIINKSNRLIICFRSADNQGVKSHEVFKMLDYLGKVPNKQRRCIFSCEENNRQESVLSVRIWVVKVGATE